MGRRHSAIRWFGVHAIFVALLLAHAAGADTLRRRGLFGVAVADAPSDVRAQLHLGNQCVIVKQVFPGSSAAEAGLLENDILVRVNDTALADWEQFTRVVKTYRSGDRLAVDLLRQGVPLRRVVTLKPFPSETSADFDIAYEAVRVDGSLRRVIVTRPRSGGRRPAILLVGGIGCYSSEYSLGESPYKALLYALTNKGFVTVRVEKSGMGDSEGPPCSEGDLDAEIRGYRAGLEAMKRYGFVDPQRIFVIGHSMGGVIAPMLAAQFPLRGLVVAETVGISWFEYELENARRQLGLSGMAADQIDTRMRGKEWCLHHLLVSKQPLAQITNERPECAEYLQYPAPDRYLQQVADLNLPKLWSSVRVPVLAIFGEADYVTTAKEHQFIVEQVNRAAPGRATLAVVPNLDHFLSEASSTQASYAGEHGGKRGPFSPALFGVIEPWLRARSLERGQ